jgi:hypothetical protein
MTAIAWMLCAALFIFYSVCLFTVCPLTFRKGYIVLGVAGIVQPVLWLIGARLPAKRRSRYAVTQAVQYLQQRFAGERRARAWETRHTPRLRWEYSGPDGEFPDSQWKD